MRNYVQSNLSTVTSPQISDLFQDIYVDYVILEAVVMEGAPLLYLFHQRWNYVHFLWPIELTQDQQVADGQLVVRPEVFHHVLLRVKGTVW